MAVNNLTYNSYGQKYQAQRVRVSSLNDLRRGDHIAFHRHSGAYWHHAIVEDIDHEEGEIHVIEYSNTPQGFSLDIYNSAGPVQIAKVVRQRYKFQDEKKYLYILKHDNCSLDPDEVVFRAGSKLGDKKYSPFTNNCEHFAVWCKTGELSSDQINKAKQIYKKTAFETMATAVVKFVTLKPVLNHTVSKAGQGVIKTGIRVASKEAVTKSVSQPAAGSSLAGGALCAAVIESIQIGRDIYSMHSDMTIDKSEFNTAAGKRIMTGVGNVGGSTVGTAIGQVLIPVPFVGAVIGSMVGGMTGKFLGNIVANALL